METHLSLIILPKNKDSHELAFMNFKMIRSYFPLYYVYRHSNELYIYNVDFIISKKFVSNNNVYTLNKSAIL